MLLGPLAKLLLPILPCLAQNILSSVLEEAEMWSDP